MQKKSQKRIKRALVEWHLNHKITSRFVAEEAGDIPMSSHVRQKHENLKKKRGKWFYVDLLFTLTNTFFPQETAELTWKAMVKHRKRLSKKLGRPVGIFVAALDYLVNVKMMIARPVLLTEDKMCNVAEFAIRDHLTGLFDRGTFNTKLDSELKRFKRYGDGFAVAMVDVDKFKKINDTFGHQVGDEVLVELAKIIDNEIRDTDTAARFGGEEFLILLPRTNCTEATFLVDRLRRHVERRYNNDTRVTISAGIADCPSHGETQKKLIGAADKALYKAKKKGRNRVIQAETGRPK
jgi:diguanylate cyclase (GGDEF)-like protein